MADVLETIKSLLALGDQKRNNSPNEAEAAMRKAKLLMEKYGIVEADLKSQGDAIRITVSDEEMEEVLNDIFLKLNQKIVENKDRTIEELRREARKGRAKYHRRKRLESEEEERGF